MKRTLFRCELVVLSILASVPAVFGADVPPALLGRWNITMSNPARTSAQWLELRLKDGRLTGGTISFGGGMCEVRDAKYENSTLSFVSDFGTYSARLDGDRLVGTHTCNIPGLADLHGEYKWVAAKALFRPTLDGAWKLTVERAGTKASLLLVLRDNHGKLTGALKAESDGRSQELKDATFAKEMLSFVAGARRYAVKVEGDRLNGICLSVGEDKEQAKLTGERQREWGKPVKLFTGTDLAGWKPLGGDSMANWKAENGELVCTGPGPNIRTEATFRDFKLHIEFNPPENGNSGVYLRGRYEIQVADGFGHKPGLGSCGALYGREVPRVNACKRPGEWQTYDITLVGQYVTVVQNGQTILDNVEIAGMTGGAMDNNDAEPGPIYLQGDHTSMRYRNIELQPALEPKP